MALTIPGAVGDDLRALADAMVQHGIGRVLSHGLDPDWRPGAADLEALLWCSMESGTLTVDAEGPPDLLLWEAPSTAEALARLGPKVVRSGLKFPLPAPRCLCPALFDLAVVPMGGRGLDERFFATVERVRVHGQPRWWLYSARCRECGQDWLVAQEERIYDGFFLKRLSPQDAHAIEEDGRWPDDFANYEAVLIFGKHFSRPCRFWDPTAGTLVWTAHDLRGERPGITVGEIADLLGVTPEAAAKLLGLPRPLPGVP